MNLNDTVRVREPQDAVERRLATIVDITYAPFTTYVQRCRLRFPNGQERTYTGHEITLCSRDDDLAAVQAAFIRAGSSLRDACRIAHDVDPKLSDDVVCLLIKLFITAKVRLGVTLGPTALPETDTAADQQVSR